MNPFNLDIVSIAILVLIVLALLYAWSDAIKLFNKSESSDNNDDSIHVFGDKVIVRKADWRNPPPTPKPYSDETHFYFKGSLTPVIAKGNYLPLIPVVCDGNQRLRYITKNGLEGIMKVSDLERAIYFPAVDPQTLKTKDSTNG